MKLTEMFADDFTRKHDATYPGMAHLAGSGPNGKTCRSCNHFEADTSDKGYYSESGKTKGGLKPARCGKYRSLMGVKGKKIPHTARACKHYEENPNPPKGTRRVW